jgi:D-3-phosphoglycerate dehydrogenase
MPRFKIATIKDAANYTFEMEALGKLDVEIAELPAAEEAFIAGARDADAIIGKNAPITRRIIDSLEKCRVISLGSVGVNQVDIAAATARGIPVTNVPDTFIDEVADHAMMLLLSSFRRLVEQDKLVREGRWSEGRPALYGYPRLIGQTLGFIAFGRVARAVATRARAFGLRMLAYDPYIEEMAMQPYGVEAASLGEVLELSDFISVHAPSTPEARHMLGEAEFRRMKPNAIFINTGRGTTVDEAALITALQQGWIAAAALDVLEQEPPGHNNPLLTMSNVTLTAHVASASARFDPARKRRVGQEIALVLSGRWPMSCVNPAVLANSPLQRWQPVSILRGPNS